MITTIKNALKFAASDWYNILFLGVILFLIDYLIDFDSPSIIGDVYDVIILISVIFLSFIEVGYGFRIVEETVKGSIKPPGFRSPLNLFKHGVKESLVLLIYFILPLLVIFIVIIGFGLFLEDDSSLLAMAYQILILLVFFTIFNILLQAAILNMAHHNGSLRFGFKMELLIRKIRQVGLKKMLVVSFITILLTYFIKQAIFDTLHELPYVGSTLGDFISLVIIAPFLLIFTTRLIGLLDVQDE